MSKEMMILTPLTRDEMQVLSLKCFDSILINAHMMSKEEIIDKICNLRDILDRF